MKLTPSYRLLPEPSILEKLNALAPEASNQILNNFQKIAEERRAQERQVSAVTSLIKTFKRAMTDTTFYYFRPATLLRDAFSKKSSDPWTSASVAINRDWAVTGDDLRAAINTYMQERNLTPQQIGLDKKETESLRYVAQKHTPACQRPPAP